MDSILEIRLCPEMWQRIKWVAERRQSTYSWVVRYALFRLIKRVDPKKCYSHIGNPGFGSASFGSPAGGGPNERAWARRSGASRKGADAKHRHRLCLYGADEQAIRHASSYYGCTMTHLTRVALELHFERIYAAMLKTSRGASRMTPMSRAFWFWLGIKIYQGVEFHSLSLEQRMLHFQRYPKGSYYGRKSPKSKNDPEGNRK